MSLFSRKLPQMIIPPVPAEPPAPASPVKPTIDPRRYGLVPAEEIRTDRAGPAPDDDLVDGLLAAGDWQRLSGFVRTLPRVSERRFAVLVRIGKAAAADDGFLRAWLAAEPSNVDALCAYAESLASIAWAIRTSDQANNVSDEQWQAFFRVLRHVPPTCGRASALDPVDPAPWLALMNGALGLQWDNGAYRQLWSEVSVRAPHSFTAVNRAWNYWRPRWYGSLELMEEFLERELAAAPPGSLLTMCRIQMLHDEFLPKDGAPRTAFHRGPRMNAALDAGIADAARADPRHVKLPYLRHWLAYELWFAGRGADAYEQFRLIGGFCGAEPWTWNKDPRARFVELRTASVLQMEKAHLGK